jgi:hypothetical protein
MLTAAASVAVATLVVLAGCLPRHPEPGGDIRPPDAHADCLIHEHREFGVCLFPHESGAFDPFEHLGRGRLGGPLRRPW